MTESLEAGRGLDVAIAVRVFGWVQRTTESNNEQLVTVPPDWTDLSARRWLSHDINELVPAYSTEIGAAWTVVEHIAGYTDPRGTDSPWMRFYRALDGGRELLRHTSAGAAEAICRAALAAVQIGEKP